jgi:hypothetical protein
MIPRMTSLRTLVGVAMAAMLSLTACGPGDPPATAAGTPTAGSPPMSSPTAAAAFTPQQVCALIDTAAMTQMTGFTITSTKPDTSGDVSSCTYKDGNSLGKVVVEYQVNGKAVVELTKAKGEAVSGLGQAAFWFTSSGQLSVELGGTAVCHVFVLDLRINNGDPKAGAIKVAQAAVPGMPHS